jgi:hypothetical protein
LVIGDDEDVEDEDQLMGVVVTVDQDHQPAQLHREAQQRQLGTQLARQQASGKSLSARRGAGKIAADAEEVARKKRRVLAELVIERDSVKQRLKALETRVANARSDANGVPGPALPSRKHRGSAVQAAAAKAVAAAAAATSRSRSSR